MKFAYHYYSSRGLFHQVRCSQYRGYWLDIPGTPANIASERGSYLFFVRVRMLLQKGIGSHNETRGAVSALSSALLGKRLLDGMELALLRQALNS
jgi:hypothetical protein